MNAKTVFISYSSKDIMYVEGITKLLKELGISYWKAPEMILAGSNYAREIPKAISECDVFLLVLSKASQESIWVEKELDNAINNYKKILPIKIDNEPLNDVYKFYLNNVQMISYSLEKESIIEIIKKHLEDKPAFAEIDEKYISPVFDADVNKETVKRQNLFTLNKAPVECKYCKGPLKEIAKGEFSCMVCGRENFDYYKTVKRYLQDNGATPAITIEKNTGVPRTAIEYFIEEGYFELISDGRR